MNVVLHEDQPRGGLDFTLGKGTLLHGRVTEGPHRSPSKRTTVVVVEEGPAVPKEFRGNPFEPYAWIPRWATTDDQGQYQIRLPCGRYKVNVSRSEDRVNVDVKDESEIVRDFEFELTADSPRVRRSRR